MKCSATILADKFAFLFEDAKKRRELRDNIAEVNPNPHCTFKPDIALTQNTVRSRTPKRQTQSHRFIYPALVRQCSFKPQVGRAPKFQRNPKRKPIGEYLQDQASVAEIRRRLKIERLYAHIGKYNKQSRKDASKKSERQKQEEYRKLFKMFDV